MGNCCWTQCCGLLRREAGRLQRAGGGGSKYFRTCSRGEHLTIEFENLVESDEGESPGSSHRPLTEEEIIDLRERHYDSIAEKQKDLDKKIQKELALQEEKLRLEEEALYAAQREAARAAKQRKLEEKLGKKTCMSHSENTILQQSDFYIIISPKQERQRVVQQYHPSSSGDHQSSAPEDDFESCMRNIKSQYEVFRSSRLSSDATVLTPNTESSCDLLTKTKSTSGNDDNTSLDLEWEDEEGMNRMLPVRERSKTEEDILRAALKCGGRKAGSNPTSASDDSNGLEWENDFVSAEVDDNGNSEYSGFVNPVLELSDSGIKHSDTDQQIR
ncbi:AP-1 complex-associated regulatory protein isoform X1 [Cavia porcellus]|uniref:AP-1 complex-associated regulatory protein isoform X1 n=1 Tax=Cavia porcellus TaxID=10141 RepID=UPI002FDF0F93